MKILSRSGLLHSVLLSLGVAGAFIVAGSWIRASPLYHLFVGTALICGGVLLAWWRKIQRLHLCCALPPSWSTLRPQSSFCMA